MTVHMLFAPTGLLKIRSDKYHKVHADLVRTYRHAKSAARTKRQRAIIKNRIFKQTAEIENN